MHGSFSKNHSSKGVVERGSKKTLHTGLVQESVILSLFGSYTSQKYQPSHTKYNPIFPIQPLELITQHEVQQFKNLLPDFPSHKGRFLICKTSQRTGVQTCIILHVWQATSGPTVTAAYF